MTQRSDFYKFIQAELCRAEQVVHEADNSNFKRHEPTIDMHRGMSVAYRKALAWLENDYVTPPGPVKIERSYSLIFCEKLLLAILVCAIILTL
jgi:hypothetical protein